MKIFSAQQIKAWDSYTIKNEPVPSLELMERAAAACFEWITHHFDPHSKFVIFCGRGNNGGDGVAIARLSIEHNYGVRVIIAGLSRGSNDFEVNLKRLESLNADITYLHDPETFPPINNEVVIDALFGIGLNKRPAGFYPDLIKYINQHAAQIISIDVPSGMYIDSPSKGNAIINANFTLTFQNKKLSFLMAENQAHTGKVVLMDIQLSGDFEEKENPLYELVEKSFVRKLLRPRDAFTHKGNYGHACLMAGCYGMMGAAVLSARACMRSGTGKTTCFVPKKGYDIMQISVPEAMCRTFGKTHLEEFQADLHFDAVAIGPGIGLYPSHKQFLKKVFKQYKKPIVIDADALNILSNNPSLYKKIPEGSILTPHPKEFERLFGKTTSDFQKICLALKKAAGFGIYIVLKGHNTFIATPDGKGYFNSTGNPGMATAGSGDVLTGILLGLLAQKYSPLHTCLIGVFLHGLAGDKAREALTAEAMNAQDIIHYLPEAFKELTESP